MNVSIEPHFLSPSALTALTQAAAAINSTLELDRVLTTIARLACTVTRGESSSVLMLDSDEKKLVVAAATGQWREAFIAREYDATLGIPGEVVKTGYPKLVLDIHTEPRFHADIDRLSKHRTRSVIAAPMVHRTKVIGVIEVVNRRDETDFNDQDLKILQVFATLAAGATQNARTHHELKQRFAGLRDSVMKRKEILGDSAVWRKTINLCDRVSRSGATVLLLGETGTGKELTARYIHNMSPRHDAAFVAVNCAALTETLLESELFGHEKGSFTGAHAQRRGWFEVATGGTLFLDEIGEISRAMQAKLLRVLQEKCFVRVGGTKSVSCDTRVIAATNRNLKHLMIDGVFREDLYYRISVFPITLPPLRERLEDIPIFVDAFVKTSARECNIANLGVAADTMDIFMGYHWPGNIRELQNVIERSVLMSNGDTLLPEHLPVDILEAARVDEGDQPCSELSRHEKQLIVDSLENHGWNQSKAARALGITRYHMRHRIKKYAIRKPDDIMGAE